MTPSERDHSAGEPSGVGAAAGTGGFGKPGEEVVRLVREVLGEDLLGAYLHGSAVLGGLRPGSDLDILVVAATSLTGRQRRALVDGLLEISGSRARRGAARPVELTIVAQSEVRPWRYPPRREFLYGEWLRDRFERGETPSPATSPDLALVITMVLLGDAPLYGPPPAEVLDRYPMRISSGRRWPRCQGCCRILTGTPATSS